jgi:hypothetical protein
MRGHSISEMIRRSKAAHGIPEHDDREFALGLGGELFVVTDSGGLVLVPAADPRDVEACERALMPVIADNA